MKNRYDLGTPDLTPDLEWMLSSKQVSNALLLEKLLQEHYPKVYQIVFSILDDLQQADRCTRDLFANALLGVHRFPSDTEVEVWLYQIAWQQCQKHARHRKVQQILDAAFSSISKEGTGEIIASENSPDDRLWQAVAGLEAYPRSLLVLHILHGWPVEMIASVTCTEQTEIQATLEKAMQDITVNWPRAGQDDKVLDKALLCLFSARWPSPNPGALNLTELAAEIGSQVGSRQRRVKPYATILEVSLLAVVVLIAGAVLFWAGDGGSGATEPDAASSASVLPVGEAVAIVSPTPLPTYHYRPLDGSRLMPRSYEFIPMPTYTPTPDGIFYGSQKGEEYAQIASILGVPLEELLRANRISEGDDRAHGQLIYIPGSLPRLTPRHATPVPVPTYTLPLQTPADSEAIARLMFPESPTYHTVWFDALLLMPPPRPFSDQQQQLRIQLWLSEDQALLLGGPVGEAPYDVLLWVNGENFVASPVEASSWYRRVRDIPGEALIDPRLLYGAILFMKDSYSYGYRKYQYMGEETIAGRSTWVITDLDEHMVPRAVFNFDQQTGFILKYSRNQGDSYLRRLQANMPREGVINAIEFNVDFPQELFNPRLPWRGGYALDHFGKPAPLAEADSFPLP